MTEQHYGGVDAAEAERVGEHHGRDGRAPLAAEAVEIASGGGPLEIDRGGEPAPLHGQSADRRLDRAARAERVAVVALGAADAQPVRVVAEYLLDRQRLGRVVERRRRAVRVDVPHVTRVGDRKSTRLNSSHTVIS